MACIPLNHKFSVQEPLYYPTANTATIPQRCPIGKSMLHSIVDLNELYTMISSVFVQ